MQNLRFGSLAIGTELTTGQIINGNAAWLSREIHKLGYKTELHLTVPDDRPLILKALNEAATACEVLFITGGLGPTSDDFTREVVGEWLGLKLEWDEESWEHIASRLSERGIDVQEIQKQQCYYPQGSLVLQNMLGTAHGFRVSVPKAKISGQKLEWLICLPGPPRELEGIWKDHLNSWLMETYPQKNPWVTKSWDVLGQPESEVATRVEKFLPDGNYEKAYRVHLPFVEFKLSYFKNDENQDWLRAIDKALTGLTVRFGGQDSAKEFLEALVQRKPAEISFYDGLSMGYLIHRLNSFQDLMKNSNVTFHGSTRAARDWELQPKAREELSFSVIYSISKASTASASESTALSQSAQAISRFYIGASLVSQEAFASPYSSDLLRERERHYFVERAFIHWTQCLKQAKKGSA